MTREQMHEMEEQRERAILVFTPDQNESWQEEELYEELKELSNTAGLDVACPGLGVQLRKVQESQTQRYHL